MQRNDDEELLHINIHIFYFNIWYYTEKFVELRMFHLPSTWNVAHLFWMNNFKYIWSTPILLCAS
jgi:hypothetical protein